MAERQEIASQAGSKLRDFAGVIHQTPVLLGFDGFVDSIIHVVDQRRDKDRYDPVPKIERFGQKIAAAAGQSANFELVTTLRKLGGNGPIMANAMAGAGLAVTYIGTLGDPAIDEVFQELAERAEVHSILEPGTTDALEFEDGKLLLGKYEHLKHVNQKKIEAKLGAGQYAKIVSRSRLIGMVNWTMLTEFETIWRKLAEELLPACREQGQDRKMVFIDLADPEKRSQDDLRKALEEASNLAEQADVVMGFNFKESGQVAQVLGLEKPDDPATQIEATARALRAHLGVFAVVVHPRNGAAAAIKPHGESEHALTSAAFEGPFVQRPKLSTGAGDNFNAGFCLGLLANLPVDQCLAAGTATSGYYVRHGQSPPLLELANFLENLPAPEPSAS